MTTPYNLNAPYHELVAQVESELYEQARSGVVDYGVQSPIARIIRQFQEALENERKLNHHLTNDVDRLAKESEDRYKAWDYQHMQAEKYTRIAEQLEKRVKSLRITLWETERDARTALKLLGIKNYENVGNMCELIAESVNDALKIDTERE